jgi:hypothetical protein
MNISRGLVVISADSLHEKLLNRWGRSGSSLWASVRACLKGNANVESRVVQSSGPIVAALIAQFNSSNSVEKRGETKK